MAWRDLESDLAELFDEGDRLDDAEAAAYSRIRAARREAKRRLPKPKRPAPLHTKTGRILSAVAAGANTPAAVAATTGLHRLDVVTFLKVLRQRGRVSHSEEGWTI